MPTDQIFLCSLPRLARALFLGTRLIAVQAKGVNVASV